MTAFDLAEVAGMAAVPIHDFRLNVGVEDWCDLKKWHNGPEG